jgi:hypothetical protein
MVDFLTRFLGPVMQRDHPDVRLMIFDHNNDHVEEVCCSLYRAHKKPPRELARACR